MIINVSHYIRFMKVGGRGRGRRGGKVEFWSFGGSVCMNPEGGTKDLRGGGNAPAPDLRGAIKPPPLNETPLTGSLSIVNGCLFFFH